MIKNEITHPNSKIEARDNNNDFTKYLMYY